LRSYLPSNSNGFHLTVIQISQTCVEFSPALIQILQMCKIPEGLSSIGVEAYTDKKGKEIFLIYKEIQKRAVAKSNMTKDPLVYD
jgi:hypothetical protein